MELWFKKTEDLEKKCQQLEEAGDEQRKSLLGLEEKLRLLVEKVAALEEKPPQSAKKSVSKGTPESELEGVREKTRRFFEMRTKVMNFNREQLRRMEAENPKDPPLKWQGAKGSPYKLINSVESIRALNKSGLGPLGLTVTFVRVFNVILIEDKYLVTISRSFRDGVGPEYMWTEYSLLPDPADTWELNRAGQSKKYEDPRIGILDPLTNKVWEPVEESSGEEDDKKDDKSSGDSSSGDSSSGDSSSGDSSSGDSSSEDEVEDTKPASSGNSSSEDEVEATKPASSGDSSSGDSSSEDEVEDTKPASSSGDSSSGSSGDSSSEDEVEDTKPASSSGDSSSEDASRKRSLSASYDAGSQEESARDEESENDELALQAEFFNSEQKRQRSKSD